jgi:hypothetical protein
MEEENSNLLTKMYYHNPQKRRERDLNRGKESWKEGIGKEEVRKINKYGKTESGKTKKEEEGELKDIKGRR